MSGAFLASWQQFGYFQTKFIGKILNILQQEIIKTEIQSNALGQFKPLEN